MKRFFVIVAALLMMMGCKETVTQTEAPAMAANYDEMRHGAISADALGADINDKYAELYGIWQGYVAIIDTVAYDPNIKNTEEMIAGKEKATVVIKDISPEGMLRVRATIGRENLLLHGTLKNIDGNQTLNLFQGIEKQPRNILTLTFNGTELSGSFKANSSAPQNKMVLTRKEFKYDATVMLEDSNEIIDWDNPKKEETPKANAKTDSKTKAKSKPVMLLRSRSQYRYTTDGIENLNASTTKLTEESLKNFTRFDLEILRNTIYARHGFAFKKDFLRNLFNSTDWYVAVSDNVDAELTAVEKQNIALLTRMEKYATDHYEYFGR